MALQMISYADRNRSCRRRNF